MLFGFCGIDSTIHGIWIKEFSELLHDGVIFPKFGHRQFQGMGGYTYFFYPPLYLYVASIFSFLATDAKLYSEALIGSAFVAILFITLNCYLWLSSKMDKKNALLLSFFYALSPALMYKFYLTAQIGMLWGAAWYPLILLGLETILKDKKKGFLILSFAQTMLFLSNIPAVIIFAPFAALYFLLLQPKQNQILVAVGAGLLAVGLAAYFLFPMFALMDQVNIAFHWDKKYAYYYDNYFINYDFIMNEKGDPNRPIFVLIYAFVIIKFVYLALAKGAKSGYFYGVIFLAFLGLFLTSDISKIIWQSFSILTKIQFPDRFLIIPTIFFVAAISSDFARYKLFVLSSIFCFAALLFIFQYNNKVDFKHLDKDFAFYFDNRIITYPVYQPVAKDLINHFYYTPHEKLTPLPHAEFAKGSGKIGEVVWDNRYISVNFSANEDSTIRVNRFFIYGLHTEINGAITRLAKDENMGEMLIDTHKCSNCKLEIWLPMLPSEKLGYIFSVISLFIFLTILTLIRKCPATK